MQWLPWFDKIESNITAIVTENRQSTKLKIEKTSIAFDFIFKYVELFGWNTFGWLAIVAALIKWALLLYIITATLLQVNNANESEPGTDLYENISSMTGPPSQSIILT